MDIRNTQDLQTTIPPKLFFRRLVAFVLDMAIFELVLGVLMFVVPLNFGMPLFQTTQCEEVTSGPLVEKVERDWPLKPGESRVNQLCLTRDLLGAESRYFESTVLPGGTDVGPVSERSVSVELERNGEPLEGVENTIGPLVGNLLVILAFSFLSANGRSTLGKRLLGIRVVTVEGAPLRFRRALMRETLRFAPWTVSVGFAALASVYSPQTLEDAIRSIRDVDASTIFQITLQAVVAVFSLVWWLFPFIRWRGQMFHDQLTGCAVRRA